MGFWRSLWQAFQHLLTASGANIVGPVLMHLDPSMALFTSGIGTIVYSAITGVPAYMGTSFSYIAPIALVMTSSWGNQGMVGGGIIAAGVTTILVGLLVRLIGWRWINILMPPSILAMVVISIGLLLAPVAWGEAVSNPLLALITFGLGVIFATKFRKGHFISALPILLSIVAGYLVALIFGQVDLKAVNAAPFFVLPRFILPVFDMRVIVPMVLVTITAVLMEHLGHLKGTSSIVGQDFIPRTSKSLIADGISNMLSWSGTPSVTYGENMGVFAITRVFSLKVMYLAGFLAVLAGFLGKLSPLILSIPQGVLGGATCLLFGLIAWAGFNLLQTEGVDMAKKNNQIIVASMGTMMIVAIIVEYLRPIVGGIDASALPAGGQSAMTTLQHFAGTLNIGTFAIPGLVAVSLLGIILNLILNWQEIVNEVKKPAEAKQPVEVKQPAEVK
ncbi:MAG TPA: solute carrier family 23 protein [Anaerolineales bacterium]|nr:solute carrier family 23 protein [Anaerolineales bacterium]